MSKVKYKKNWEKIPIRPDRLSPPPPSDNLEYFEFHMFLKNVDPPSIMTLRTPWTDISRGLLRHIYIESGQIK